MFTIGSAAETHERNTASQSTSSSSSPSNTTTDVNDEMTRKMEKVLELRYAFLRNHNLSAEEDVEFQDFIRLQSHKMMPVSRPVSSGTTPSSTSSSASTLSKEARGMSKVNNRDATTATATSAGNIPKSRQRGSKSHRVKKFLEKAFCQST